MGEGWMQAGVFSLGLSLLIVLAATPIIRRLSITKNFFERTGGVRLRRGPLPKGGGVGLYLAFWLTVWCVLGFDQQRVVFWLATTLLLVVGLIDDHKELSWYVKLLGQGAAAALLVGAGERIAFVTHPLSGESVFIGWWGVPLTMVWLVALTNMVNLIDGLDGLAAGASAIATVPLVIVAAALGRYDAAVMALAIAGATLGFLPFNFFPARIIMGDAGALFLGFTLAAISVEGAVKGTTALALTVPILAFGFPILETLLSVMRRVAAGQAFYTRDLGHMHYRLLASGLSHRQAVFTLYGLSAVMAWGAVIAFETGVIGSIIVFLLAVALAVVFVRRIGALSGTSTGTEMEWREHTMGGSDRP